MFNMVKWQEEKANDLLSKKSFINYFNDSPYANAGYSKQGRRRALKKLADELTGRGYTEDQANQAVKDVVRYARLLNG